MGDHEEWSQPRGGLLPNGLLPNAGPLLESLDSVRWLKAEERTAELIACIQPNQPSEERRNAVADYVQRLIMKCFPCQVFTFGSVPLKTYLPDGDIDLTAFSNNANLKDSWASEVRDMLETEEKNENAEFHVKEVQYIQAEVKIIKCLVENIVVDISFNQLGGLCTLCFLEEVDNLINQNHLFKRSIILIKAWCYYESRILGAHHGLISTYALETLVLYIFHVFNNSFAGPLEVLYRFLEFFSNFDWETFCVSLWGPVPISSLPDVTAEPPRKDSGDLLLNKVFLDACSSVYAVFPSGQDSQGQIFVSKHFNVIDPLRVSNNLGRSVSKGNFFRIRSAFAFGAKRLARLLDCPKENLVSEVNQFFTNTWERHGSGIRPDAPGSTLSDNQPKINPSGKKFKQFVEERVSRKGHGNSNRGQKGHLLNDIQRSPFARTQSSPELTDTYSESGKPQNAPNRRKNMNVNVNVEPELPNRSLGLGFDGFYQHEQMSSSSSTIGAQEEQDLVNMMAASSGFDGFNGQIHMPMNHLQFPFSPSFLGYAQRNFANIPMNMIDPAFYSPFFANSEDSTENFTSPDREPEASFEPDKVNTEIAPMTGLNYIPPARRVGGSGGLVRSQHKYNKEKRGPDIPEHSNFLENRVTVNDAFSDERSTSSRFSSAVKSKTSSESSWDETSTVPKKGKKPVVSGESSSGYVKGKTMFESTSAQPSENDDSPTIVESVPRSHVPVYEPAQTSGSDPIVSLGPMILGHNPNPRQRIMDNSSGAMPLTFYPTGPPVPFLTMLPFYNVPSQPGPSGPSGPSDPSTSQHFRGDESIENGDLEDSDILNSDFASHWQNLQFGRFCQSPRQHGPTVYPSSMVPPVYLQGRVPWDGPGRPGPSMNLVTQIMNYGPCLVPVVSNRPPPNVYRSGTGTYLPNPKVSVNRDRDRPRRGNYNHDRTENHTESNWNSNSYSKSRGSNRNHKSSSRSMNSSYRNDSYATYQSQNGPYGVYSNSGGSSSNGSSMVMVYPYENNTGFGSHSEQLEFGSLGSVGFSGGNEQSQDGPRNRGGAYGGANVQRASPDRASSPHHQRRV